MSQDEVTPTITTPTPNSTATPAPNPAELPTPPAVGGRDADGNGSNGVPSMATKGSADYGADDIAILEGREHVRKRPGMYIGSTGITGLHHCVWEVVDNSVDEAMAGYASKIDVSLLADGGCRVEDNGRGIPVAPVKHPDKKYDGKPAAEIALGVLNAGGKFGEGSGYKVSGGLHGVGVSVVNALSVRLAAEIDREGNRYALEFHKGGLLKKKLEIIGKAPKGRTGTTVTFWPDPTIFETVEFKAETMLERFRMMAFLNAGLEICFRDERPNHDVDGDGKPDVHTFKFDKGLIDFVKHLNASKDPLFVKVPYFKVADEDGTGEAEVALQWNTGFYEGLHSFANGIATIEGGTHVEGFRTALTSVMNKWGREKGQIREKDENLQGEDIREGLTAIISVKLREPQFEGQTKGKLGNTSMKTLVQKATNEKLAEWFEENPTEAGRIIKKAQVAQQARIAARKARDVARKSATFGGGLPGKLKDCSSKNPAESELFIVEGDSAMGSATDARDPRIQAILPIRGKILNVERARIDKMMKNTEIQALITAIGGGVGVEFDASKARYNKVIALCDADVDGAHIRTLLLTFFYRQMKPLVEAGFVYIAQPPLFSVLVGKNKQYLKDDAAKAQFLLENPNKKFEFSRLKGLGEMDADELGETTMEVSKRTLLQVTVEQAAIADEVMSILMGDEVESRKQFIIRNAGDIRFLDI
jgi:DNA gyrase subunit B